MQPIITESAPIFTGTEQSITLPTGRVVLIRETNGDDDELLSKLGSAHTGENVLNFLANITQKDSYLGKKPMVDDIAKWPSSDKYYLLFKQRLFNQGEDLKFTHVCQNQNCDNHKKEVAVNYEYDLKEFDGDIASPDYQPKTLNQVRRYPNKAEMILTLTTSSQKSLQYKIMTSELEQRQLAMPSDDTTRNSKVRLRELSIFNANSKWELLTHFKMFPSREMSEIRKHIQENDPLFDPMVTFSCQLCKTPYRLPLFELPSFYWPEETI